MIAIFVFYNVAQGYQARLAFSDEFKHCNIITYDGEDWILLDLDATGYRVRHLIPSNGTQLLRALRSLKEVSALISVNINKRHRFGWKPFIGGACNEICRYGAGIDLGFTFNPIHLYKKLLKYRHKRNYEMLSHWRRKHGVSRRQQ